EPAFPPGVRVFRTDPGRAPPDPRGRREFLHETEDTAPTKPGVVGPRTQFQGAKVPDRGPVPAGDPGESFPGRGLRRAGLVHPAWSPAQAREVDRTCGSTSRRSC